MKLMRWSIALFFFFIGVFAGVRHLDGQSALYEKCVDDLIVKTSGPALYPRDHADILKKLQDPHAQFTLGDQTCPRLLTRHRMILETQLMEKTRRLDAAATETPSPDA